MECHPGNIAAKDKRRHSSLPPERQARRSSAWTPGGPFRKKKDHGAWTIPKGLIAFGEAPLDAAKREFEEETGHRAGGDFIALGDAKQPSGKTVHVWAAEDDWNPDKLKSNMFQMEWPPRSGKYQNFPELDRASWFETEAARERILKGQAVFLDRLRDAFSKDRI
jgi:predicted NUDIX family NTP pyrophosphohydrolase